MAPRTWLITGTSRGFGRAWAAAALARGDRVVGTARDTSTTDDLAAQYPDTFWALPLDVTEEPPLRCFFGATPLQITESDYASRLETWRAWQAVADVAQG
jgi:NAD(P)-dependent dehydrogenase (short-subunit alcohol dehydrogenase family)